MRRLVYNSIIANSYNTIQKYIKNVFKWNIFRAIQKIFMT